MEALLFLMGFTSVTAVYEIAKTAKVSSGRKKIAKTLEKQMEDRRKS